MTNMDTIEKIQSDPEMAWGWHCNIAVPLMDSLNLDHETANVTAAYLMSHLFGVDITTHPQFQYEKGGAQSTHEFMMTADGR
ncbi:hypothetical protein [Sphingomonas sp. SRS2]|uniref:hypothetical protein n=1 Tax=Sphingomonas sp. SRS2 TaxID=133190 RepID=UPI000620134D|nr:hypothetical protein [Sphingomonas sp. SRS2]KKC25819.1 hypothetical protein WP12_12250 [Sphingomonas sp. SRS2]